MSQEVLLALISLASALGGGILVKVLDKWLPSGDKRLADRSDIRGEIWERLAQVENDLRALQEELDEWKMKYYTLLGEHHELKAENHGIREENHKLLSKLSALTIDIQRSQRQLEKLSTDVQAVELVQSAGPTLAPPGSGLSIIDEDPPT